MIKAQSRAALRLRNLHQTGSPVAEYRRALTAHTAAFVTGGSVAAIAALASGALGVPIPGWLYGAVFLGGGFLIAGYKAWAEQYRRALDRERLASDLATATAERDSERQRAGNLAADAESLRDKVAALSAERVELRERLAKQPTGPKLSLVFDPSDPLCIGQDGGNQTLRVKVLNDGDLRAQNVAVALTDSNPPILKLFQRRFSVMKGGQELFDVSPSRNRPAVYVDVLHQRPHASYGATQILALKGADWLTQGINSFKIVLGVEADITAAPLELNLQRDSRGFLRVVAPG